MQNRSIFKCIGLLCLASTSSYAHAQTQSLECGANPTLPIASKMAMFLDGKKYPNYFMVCAHRGHWYKEPENTAASLQMAINLGMDCVENDVRETKDGQLVIFHDKETSARLYDGVSGQPVSRQIKDMTWQELQSLRYLDRESNKTNDAVLSLDQFLNITNARLIVNHEEKTKDWRMFRRLVQAVVNKGQLQTSIFKGRYRLADFRQAISGIVAENAIVFTPVIFDDDADKVQKWTEYRQAGYKRFELVITSPNSSMLAWARQLRDEGGRLGQFDVLPESGRGSFWTGKWVDPATYKPTDDWRRDWDFLVDTAKANYLISDRPCLMMQYLTKMGKRNAAMVQPVSVGENGR